MQLELGPAAPRRSVSKSASLAEFSIPEDPEEQVRHLMAVTEEQREELQRLQGGEVDKLQQQLAAAQRELAQVYAKGEELHRAFEKKCDETAEFAGKAAFLSVEAERSKELEAQVEQHAEQQAETERSYNSVLRKTGRTVDELTQRATEWHRMGVEDCRSFAVRREAQLRAELASQDAEPRPAKASPPRRPSCIPTPGKLATPCVMHRAPPSRAPASPQSRFETPRFETPFDRRSVGAENACGNLASSPPRQTKLFDPSRSFTPLPASFTPAGSSFTPRPACALARCDGPRDLESASKGFESARKLGLGLREPREPLAERRPRVPTAGGPRRVPIR